MARRPIRQLMREARDAQTSRHDTDEDFDNWLIAGLGKAPDRRTKAAAFHIDDGQLSIEFDFPSIDELDGDYEDDETRAAEYQRLLCEMALRCVYHVTQQDSRGAIATITFDGFVDTIDLATGRDIRPSLVHFEVTRPDFDALDLSRVDPVACVRGLGAELD